MKLFRNIFYGHRERKTERKPLFIKIHSQLHHIFCYSNSFPSFSMALFCKSAKNLSWFSPWVILQDEGKKKNSCLFLLPESQMSKMWWAYVGQLIVYIISPIKFQKNWMLHQWYSIETAVSRWKPLHRTVSLLSCTFSAGFE